MKIFARTFTCTLLLLFLIALFANGLIYLLMPGTYTDRKQREMNEKTDAFVASLESADRSDIIALTAQYADSLRANVSLRIGADSYTMLTWDGGVITEISDENGTDAATPGTGAAEADTSVTTSTVIISKDFSQSSAAGSAGSADSGSAGDSSVSAMAGYFAGSAAGIPGAKSIRDTAGFTLGGETGELTAIVTLAPVDEAVGVIVSLLPITLFLCVVIAVAFSLLYARAITRPIKLISEETLRMRALDREASCRIASKDEIGTLADNVNALYGDLLNTIESLETELGRAGAAEKAKSDFLRAASHELKTPVTAVSVIMDNMILGVGKYKNTAEWLPKCRALIGQLSDMLRDILDASRLEGDAEECVTESIESVCAGILEPYILIARAKGLSLLVDWSAAFPVTVPPKLLGKAVSNVFSNAVQYTAPGGRLAIYCRDRKLVVENECESLGSDQLPRLTEPFYRPDGSRSRETGGNGLGLYIADTVFRLLGLDYTFEPMSSPGGMRFTVFF
jgi:two-component system sensor kinase Ihk